MCTACFNQKVEYSMNVRQENYWLFLFSASSFSFSQPENCHIIFVFSRLFFPQPWKLSEDTFMLWIKSILILSLITLCVNCRCLIICLPCSVPSFFLWHGFLFSFYLEQHPIVCPLKFRIMGYFSLSYCPLINLKYANSCYHRTCRIAWHLMQFKVLLVY
jgi:hypothetical protein